MADQNAAELIKQSDKRWSARRQLDTFRHEVALNFAPWHASWTSPVLLGDDFAAHLIDGTPLLLARDFIGQVGSMLRPAGKQWFWHRTAHEELNNDRGVREYLDWRSRQMSRILFDPVTAAHRALKISDEFFGLFGDAVVSVDYGARLDSLRLSAWHTKDCVWAVGESNKVDTLTRRQNMSARAIMQRWGKTARKGGKAVPDAIEQSCEKEPDKEFEIRHCVMPADEYEAYNKGNVKPAKGEFVSVWVSVTGEQVLAESQQRTMRYVVPRWVTLPHTQYAISPATTIALPDARLIQQQALAILEAAEKQINPPIVANADVVRGDVSLMARGITWIDRSYDERNGDALKALELGKNFQLGVESLMRTEHQLTRAFYLDVLRMPDTRQSKSTVEVQFKIDEYVRAALPLFAPMQVEYNEALLREVDAMIEMVGGYKVRERPSELKDLELLFQWDNPLTDMLERQKATMVGEISQIGQTIAALEAAAAQAPALKQLDPAKAFRESVIGLGASAWLLDEEDAEEEGEQIAQQNKMQGLIAAAPSLAKLVDSGTNAAQAAAALPNPASPSMPMLPAPE